MKAIADGKYALRDLHQEIDLLDRKIAHCRSVEKFDCEPERESALQKLIVKRESLVATALGMAGRGIECNPKYLPRSFRDQSEDTSRTR